MWLKFYSVPMKCIAPVLCSDIITTGFITYIQIYIIIAYNSMGRI